MSATSTKVALSPRDVDFLDRLRELVSVRQSTMPAATKAPGRTADDQGMDATQREMRDRWDFDGSIVVGRVDTVDGETYYIGTRAVSIASEGTLVHAEEGDLARRLWQRTTRDRPGDVVMKRHLRVSYWSLVDARTDFDLRGDAPEPGAATKPAAAGGGTRSAKAETRGPARGSHQAADVDLAALATARKAAAAALTAAAEAVTDGRVAVDDVAAALDSWNAALRAAGSAYSVSGDALTLAAVEEAADQRRRAARRAELDHKIAVLAELMDDGDLGRDDLEALQRKLVRMRDEADSLRE